MSDLNLASIEQRVNDAMLTGEWEEEAPRDREALLKEVKRLQRQEDAASELVKCARQGRLEVRPGSYADDYVRGQFAVADRLADILTT